MKAIILITSIFYILGLKISHKIEIGKQYNPIEKIITVKPESNTDQSKSITLREGLSHIDKDSLQNNGSLKTRLQVTK